MEQIISNIIDTTINSFDFSFCLIANIATYITIKTYTSINFNHKLTTWNKRGIFIIISFILALIYYFIGSNIKVLVNSIIIAPVSWSWIFKPICNKLNINYNKFRNSK